MSNMDWKVIITGLARENLLDIKKYIKYELQLPNAADKLIQRIKNGIDSLNIMPERNPLCNKPKWYKRGLRKLIIGKYIVFYVAVVRTHEVLVITVLNGTQDIHRKLNNLDIPLLQDK